MLIEVVECGDGVCDEVEVTSCAADCPCNTVADCCDLDGNGIRDNGCTWCSCEATACNLIPLEPVFAGESAFADMGSSFGGCLPDGQVNIHDRIHALLCFEGQSPCDVLNIDAGGAFGACPPDGFCNIHDITHVNRVFSGESGCDCPTSPYPEFPPEVVGSTAMDVVADRRSMRPGETVAVRVFTRDPIKALQSFQLHVGVSGGERGRLELVDIAIEPRRDAVFVGTEPSFTARNVATSQILAGLESETVAVEPGGYLATYTYRPSRDARGTFVIDTEHEWSEDDQTFLVSKHGRAIYVTGSRPAMVQVNGGR